MSTDVMSASDVRRLTPPAWRTEVWRLWRSWKWAAAACWFVLLAGAIGQVYPVIAGKFFAGNTADRHAVLVGVLYPLVYHLYVQLTGGGTPSSVVVHGQPIVGGAPMLTAFIFACVVVVIDRNRGGLLYAVTGPTRRWDLWWVRSAFAMVVPLSALTAKILLVGVVDGSANWVLPAGIVGVWWGLNMLVVAAMVATALFVSACIGPGLFAGMIGFGVCLLPALAGAVLRGFGTALAHTAVPPSALTWMGRTGTAWIHLSPFVNGLGVNQGVFVSKSPGAHATQQMLPIVTDTHVHVDAAIAVWLVLWVVVFLTLSWLAFRTAQVERWSELFIHPSSALPTLWLAAATLATLLAQGAHHSFGANFGWVFGASWFVFGTGFQLRWQRAMSAASGDIASHRRRGANRR